MTGCPSCRYQGAEPFAAQANPGARRWPEGGADVTIGTVSETAPTEARQRFNRGLTTDSTPD